jgi:hypothetical protein
MESRESKTTKTPVAPGLQESAKIAEFPQAEKRKRGGSKPGRETPWMIGSRNAETHGFYRQAWDEEEIAARNAWLQSMIEEKGNPTFAERSLLTTASWLNAIIIRAFKAMEEGKGAPAHDHLLAIVNSFRLIMTALGLERKTKPTQSLQDYLQKKVEAKEVK